MGSNIRVYGSRIASIISSFSDPNRHEITILNNQIMSDNGTVFGASGGLE